MPVKQGCERCPGVGKGVRRTGYTDCNVLKPRKWGGTSDKGLKWQMFIRYRMSKELYQGGTENFIGV